ncbi:MAG: hypothetical protein MJZ00_08845, partial [Paludibacteraceae bacterium]|nr:hypothetical protein [Paludibacteraceae bacterium]
MSNILKKILLTSLPLMAIGANADAPQSFNYQSVVRSVDGVVVSRKTVYVRVDILTEEEGVQQTVYSEKHVATTNANGSFSIRIGEGETALGRFSQIDWAKGSYFIKTYTSTSENMSDAAVAITSLSSVPYALYSIHSADSFSGRWNDLKDKPDMAQYATMTETVDSLNKILTNYATADDVQDIFNRGIRTNNYRIDSLKSVIASNQKSINKLEETYVKKEDTQVFLKPDTLAAYARRESINEFKEIADSTLNDYGNRLKISENKITNLTTTLTKSDSLLDAKVDSKFAEATEANKNNAAAIDSLSKDLNTQIKESSNKTDAKTDSLSNAFNKKLNKLDMDMANALDQEVAAIETKISNHEESINDHNSRIGYNATNISSLNNLTKQISGWATVVNAQADSLNKVISAMQAKHKADSLAADSKIKALESTLSTLNGNLNDVIATKVAEILASDNGVLARLSALETATSDLSTLTSDVNTLKTDVSSLSDAINNTSTGLVKKYADLNNTVNSLNTTIGSSTSGLVKNVNDLNSKLSNLESTIGSSTSGLVKNVNDLNSKLSNLESTIGSSTSGLVKNVNDLNNKLSNLESTIGSSTSGLIKDVNDMSSEVSSLKSTIGSSTSGLVKDVNDLNSKLSNLESTIGSSTSGLIKDVNDMSSEVSSLKSTIGSSTS